MKLFPVFTDKPKIQPIRRFLFQSGILNGMIMNQWEFSLLEKANSKKSELLWILFGNRIVFKRI
jgi:hypothetical protein